MRPGYGQSLAAESLDEARLIDDAARLLPPEKRFDFLLADNYDTATGAAVLDGIAAARALLALSELACLNVCPRAQVSIPLSTRQYFNRQAPADRIELQAASDAALKVLMVYVSHPAFQPRSAVDRHTLQRVEELANEPRRPIRKLLPPKRIKVLN